MDLSQLYLEWTIYVNDLILKDVCLGTMDETHAIDILMQSFLVTAVASRDIHCVAEQQKALNVTAVTLLRPASRSYLHLNTCSYLFIHFALSLPAVACIVYLSIIG